MRKHIAIFIAILTSVLFAACSKDDADDSHEELPNRMTVMMFFPWSGTSTSNGLYPFVVQNVKEIQQAIIDNKGFSQVRFVCFMSDTPISSVLYEMKYRKGKCECDTVHRYGQIDFSDESTLTRIFLTSMQSAPAERYGMIVGGHGSGWLPPPATTPKKTRYIGGYSGIYATDTQVFAKALEATGKKLSYIIFDNCYMANIEVAYELRNSTDLMIASASEIIERGIPYQSIFKYFVFAPPNVDDAINEFYQFYQSYTYPYGTLSAIDCSKVEKMADVMRRVNNGWSIESDQLNLVQKLDGYTSTVFYDMADYVHHFCDDKTLVAEFDNTMNQLVLHKKWTDLLYCETTGTRFRVNTFCGITISDPSESLMAKGKTETNWYKDTH